jgi:hypothetical protein
MSNRLPKNIEGDFYATGSICTNGTWMSDCTACGLPEYEAPNLLAELNDLNLDTYFIKQPETAGEIEQAISASDVCCTDAIRYGGKDKKIIEKMLPHLCDYKISILGNVVPNNGKWWLLW